MLNNLITTNEIIRKIRKPSNVYRLHVVFNLLRLVKEF